MKVKDKNISIYAGQDERALRHRQEAALGKNQKNQNNQKGISAVSLNNQSDRILMKKQQAQKKALKIVGDTFSAEKKIDKEVEDIRAQADEYRKQLAEIKGYIADLENTPTDEMDEEMRTAHEAAIQSYKMQSQALEDEKLYALGRATYDIEIDRLKSTPMLKAQDAAEEIMEAANDEILGMLMEEAKDHIDEEQEKREEEAEKIAEKKEEQEEQLDKSKEKSEELEEVTDAIREAASDSADVQKELDDILEKLKLLKEDLKGAKVDQKL